MLRAGFSRLAGPGDAHGVCGRLLTIIAAALIALTKDDIKARIAYSTVSHLSYIVMGVAMLSRGGVEGGISAIAHDAFPKITLFFAAGCIMVVTGSKKISLMNGLGRRMPWTFGVFALATFSFIGLAPASGFLSKFYLTRMAAAFYTFIYVLMNFACFWVICRVSEDGRNLQISDLDGLHKRSPVLALVMTVGALALVGLPPTAGFMGKLFLLTAAWNRGVNWLVIVGAVNVAVSLYYYLNLIRHAYAGGESNESPIPIRRPFFSNIWGGVLATLLIVLGIFPGPLFDVALKLGSGILAR